MPVACCCGSLLRLMCCAHPRCCAAQAADSWRQPAAGADGAGRQRRPERYLCACKACGLLHSYLHLPICCAVHRRRLTADANPPQELTVLDGSAILRIAFGPAAPAAAISTLNGLYYMDPFAEGVHPSKPCN